MESAIHRRLLEELGLRCPLHFLFKFQYQAQFDATGAENELCSVFIGCSADSVKINSQEIHSWRWISPEALQAEMARSTGNFTPWFELEWARIWRGHRAEVLDLQSELGSRGRSR
jgi:isopentenyl-diphosphate Delta-isomerase